MGFCFSAQTLELKFLSNNTIVCELFVYLLFFYCFRDLFGQKSSIFRMLSLFQVISFAYLFICLKSADYPNWMKRILHPRLEFLHILNRAFEWLNRRNVVNWMKIEIITQNWNNAKIKLKIHISQLFGIVYFDGLCVLQHITA